jgi:hypothetical protein
MYKITIDYPNMPKGQEVTIHGLGTFKNGSTTVVEKDDADMFRVYQRDTGLPDRTLLQAFQKSEYITVETFTPEPPKEEPKTGEQKKDGDK